MNDPVKLAKALDSSRLAALNGIDRYDERDRYARVVAEELAPRRFADVAHAFDEHGIWYERVQDYDDLRDDPQVLHKEIFREIEVKAAPPPSSTTRCAMTGRYPNTRAFPSKRGNTVGKSSSNWATTRPLSIDCSRPR